MSDFPPPPFVPDAPTPPPTLGVPYAPPEVGMASPWAPADGENRDQILDWWRMWWQRVFFPWIAAFIAYWADQWSRLAAYLNTWITSADTYITTHAVPGHGWWVTATPISATGTTDVALTAESDRVPQVNDLVSDESSALRYGIVTVVIDPTHVTVMPLGVLRGLAGFGWWSTATAIAHTGATAVVLASGPDRAPQINDLVVDTSASAAYGEITAVTDPTHVTVAFIGTLQGPSGGGSGTVAAVVAGPHISVDSADPTHPIVSVNGVVIGVVAGSGVTVDNTDPTHPIVNASGGGSGVAAVAGGSNIYADNTDPTHPIINFSKTVTRSNVGNSVILRDGAGNAAVADPIASDDIATKNYVDTAGYVVDITAGAFIVVTAVDPRHPHVSVTGTDVAANPNTIANRDASAQIIVSTTYPTTANAAASAFYVDAHLITNHDTAHAPIDPYARYGGQPAPGQMYFDTTLNKLRVWSGTAWETITSA